MYRSNETEPDMGQEFERTREQLLLRLQNYQTPMTLTLVICIGAPTALSVMLALTGLHSWVLAVLFGLLLGEAMSGVGTAIRDWSTRRQIHSKVKQIESCLRDLELNVKTHDSLSEAQNALGTSRKLIDWLDRQEKKCRIDIVI